jgi:hypothetical protein
MADHTRVVQLTVVNVEYEPFRISAVPDPMIASSIQIDGGSNIAELIISATAVTSLKSGELCEHYVLRRGDLVSEVVRMSRSKPWVGIDRVKTSEPSPGD